MPYLKIEWLHFAAIRIYILFHFLMLKCVL